MRRPTDKRLQRFRIADIGDDTIAVFLTKGYSLAICRRDCPRRVEWTPPDLNTCSGDRPTLRIAALAGRLTCIGEEGFGSHDIAVFPHPYDGPWTWTSPSET